MSDPLVVPPAVQDRLNHLGLEFEADFYDTETQRHPENLDALIELGHVFTHMNRFSDGLRIDRELARLLPDSPTVQYNLACSLALMGKVDPALDALEQAVALGYDDPDHLLNDVDMQSLWGEPRLRELVRLMERVTLKTCEG